MEGAGYGDTHERDGCEFYELLQRSCFLDLEENEDKLNKEAREHAKKNR